MMTGAHPSSRPFSSTNCPYRRPIHPPGVSMKMPPSAALPYSAAKAKCNNCHVEPLWTDPGWNLHMPSEICIDSFQANRAPDLRYRTSPIGDLFTHFKGGFYHDGRFPTLGSVVDHYDACMGFSLTNN